MKNSTDVQSKVCIQYIGGFKVACNGFSTTAVLYNYALRYIKQTTLESSSGSAAITWFLFMFVRPVCLEMIG